MSGLAGRPVAELFRLDGRVALVTGGATGLGLQIATALAEAGADVVLCGRNGARCEEVAGQLEALGVRALGLACNVRDAADVEAMVTTVTDRFGKVDVLVNNSGTSWGAAPEDYPLDGWDKVIEVNLTGAFLCARAVGRVMLERGYGKIVNVASVAGIVAARPEIRQAVAYTASKGGVISMTRELACTWASRGIWVNAIAPGWFPTAISDKVLDQIGAQVLDGIPLGRYGGPDELKGAALFLCSAASDYVTGQTLVVDGGRTAW